MDDFNNKPLDQGNTGEESTNANVNPTPSQYQAPNPSPVYNGYSSIPPQQPPYPPSYYGQPPYTAPQPAPTRPEEPYQWNFEGIHQAAAATPPKKKNKGARIFGLIAAVIALSIVGSFACYGIYVATTGDTLHGTFTPAPGSDSSDSSASSPAPLPQFSVNDKPAGATTASDTGLSNSDIFKKVSPTVVGIVSYLPSSPFTGSGGQEQGSGIIMSADGYIITNAHVVAGAGSIEVVLADGKTYEGTVVGMDIPTDLAVVKIDATGLVPAEFGDSSKMEVGERVVAIGNPGGLQFASSLTVGYVSALNRSLSSGEAGYELNCIQTDAAINPGNSGGALINAYGQVVGINSAKIKATGFEGMGFAIPISDAIPILKDIIENGKVTGRAMLGIEATSISPTEAQYNNIPMGLQIRTFTEGTNLEKQGAQLGDIITHINSTPVYTTTSSAAILKDYKPGDTVTLSIYRMNSRGRATTFNIDVVLIGS